ncbi:type II toxin-antitoxin system RelE/ParE family toxin [Achromobacter xylosoxidans]|uniref:type II toxin-antitoxin system RelE/ParE family toxin n=1 Tax=Alcaligenes xylosoxydans xylosoxydans TaxID=85698 RepID=UPI000B490D66|nr:type II toxin-antitoxin system RelE/ParE family toxin [Achromobacter xylosoxidans]
MKAIRTTVNYDNFESSLKDLSGRARIQARIQRLAHGNPGDHRHLKNGVSELRIDVGPGYRVYYTERENSTIVILLVGGDKSKQQLDIDLAYKLAGQL